MSQPSPFFSIIITTRNRANLLPFAIQSVLRQSYGDFELIISDNFSSDNTAEIVQSFDDKRIRRVRTSESLSMSGHYKFALRKTRGEYVIFLSDDDAFTVDLLKKVKEVLEETKSKLICWQFANYYLNQQKQTNLPLFHPLRSVKKNTVQIPTFSSGLYEVLANTKSGQKFFESNKPNESLLAPPPRSPQLTNAAYHKSIFKNIENRGIDLFRSNVLPDIYAGIIVTTEVEKYFYLDLPLTIFCKNEVSTTANSTIDKEKYVKSFSIGEIKKNSILPPIKNWFNYNYQVNSVLEAKKDFKDRLAAVELDLKAYYSTYYVELMFHKRRGINIDQEFDDFHTALANESQAVQDQIQSFMSESLNSKIRQMLLKIPRPQILINEIARRMPQTLHNRSIIINGKDAGFENITQCGEWLTEVRLKELSNLCLSIYSKRYTNLAYRWRLT